MGKKILITGGSGFIGTNLVDYYFNSGNQVLNIDISVPKLKSHLSLWKKVDICDFDLLNKAVHDFSPDIIFHLAARTDLDGESLKDYSANTVGVSNLIQTINELSIKPKVIFTSSMLVCKIGYQPIDRNDYCPENPYGSSKMEGEKIVHLEMNHNYEWAIIRPISIWGPWNGAPYFGFFESVINGWYVHPLNQNVSRNYGFVLNTIKQLDSVANILSTKRTGFTIYLGDYKPLDILTWANTIQTVSGAPKVKSLPLFLFKFGAVLGDFLKILGLHFPLTSFRLKNMLTSSLYDLSDLQEICPNLQYTLEDGVKETLNWYKNVQKKLKI